MTADICNHSENLADMCHGTVHGPDTLDFSRTSKQDHVRSHACMCAHVHVHFGDVPVLLRNSKDQKVRKQKVRKDGKILIGLIINDISKDIVCENVRPRGYKG